MDLFKKTLRSLGDYTELMNDSLKRLDETIINEFKESIIKCRNENKTLFICGNGGSAGNSNHIANDFLYGLNSKSRNYLSVESLSANVSVLTCLGNDIGYENIYSYQLKTKAKKGDCLLVLSGSGNSKNILNALDVAKAIGIKTIGILGYDGGAAKNKVDIAIHINCADMQIAEDGQMLICHYLIKSIIQDGI